MKLGYGEHSILATFSNNQEADEAIKALQAAGITEVQLESINRFNVANTANGSVLSSDNLSDTISSSAKILLASDPSMSGYEFEKSGGHEHKTFMVSVLTNTNQLNQALKIIQKYGGEV